MRKCEQAEPPLPASLRRLPQNCPRVCRAGVGRVGARQVGQGEAEPWVGPQGSHRLGSQTP